MSGDSGRPSSSGFSLLWLLAIFLAAFEGAWWFASHAMAV
jgi:hypothetical protein